MGALVLGDAGKEEGSWLLHLFSVVFQNKRSGS